MGNIILRSAEARDIPDILRLLSQVNLVHHTIRPDLFNLATKYSEEDLKALLQTENRFTYAAESDGVFLGYIFCELQQIVGNPLRTEILTFYIDDLCVDEAARGKDVGRALYEYAKAQAKAMGCYHVTLHVWEGNDRAEGFYRKCGLTNMYTCLEEIL